MLLALLVVVVVIAFLWLSNRTKSPEVRLEKPSQRMGPPDIYSISALTPGAANPDITQENINQTICNPNWSTKSERPPVSYTNRLKREGVQDYGYSDRDMRDYEEDHLIPLEIGGNPTDPKNLWPEPYHPSIDEGGAHAKDKVENYLHDQVCSGRMTLQDAQKAIVADWYAIYLSRVKN